MAKYESKDTWFDPALVAQREAKHTIKVNVYYSAPDVPAELRKIYDRYNHKGVVVDRAMETLQDYHEAVGRLLEWHRATTRPNRDPGHWR